MFVFELIVAAIPCRSNSIVPSLYVGATARGTTGRLAGGTRLHRRGGVRWLTRQSHYFYSPIVQLHRPIPFLLVCSSATGVLSVVDHSRRVRRMQDSTRCTNTTRAHDKYRHRGVYTEGSGLLVSCPIFCPVPLAFALVCTR